jgi:N-(5'phosphoribosyl)anthranilate (PRA) isomerase
MHAKIRAAARPSPVSLRSPPFPRCGRGWTKRAGAWWVRVATGFIACWCRFTRFGRPRKPSRWRGSGSTTYRGGGRIECANDYRGVADFLLLNSHEPGDRQIGGLGRTHDWSISRRIVDEVGVPAILAGGLDAGNVAAAIAEVRPAGVDLKTKTDRADGNGKDLDKVRRFVAAAKLTTSRQ